MKMILAIAAAALFSVAAPAAMDSRDFSATVIATGTGTVSSVIRGELQGVFVDIAAGQTGTVRVTTGELTAFEKTGIIADGFFIPTLPVHTAAGVANFGLNVGGTNAVVSKIPLAGLVTVRFIGESAGTNAYKARLIFNR